jgi:hypothetical protein
MRWRMLARSGPHRVGRAATNTEASPRGAGFGDRRRGVETRRESLLHDRPAAPNTLRPSTPAMPVFGAVARAVGIDPSSRRGGPVAEARVTPRRSALHPAPRPSSAPTSGAGRGVRLRLRSGPHGQRGLRAGCVTSGAGRGVRLRSGPHGPRGLRAGCATSGAGRGAAGTPRIFSSWVSAGAPSRRATSPVGSANTAPAGPRRSAPPCAHLPRSRPHGASSRSACTRGRVRISGSAASGPWSWGCR